MKKINKCLLLLFCTGILSLFATPAQAQTVTVGTKGKFIMMDQIMGGTTTCVSGNGKYIGGYFTTTAGYLYDIEKDTVYILNIEVAGVSNDMVVVGSFEKSPEQKVIRVWSNGVYKDLPSAAPANASPSTKSNFAYGISDDGKTITGMGYRDILSGRSKTYEGVVWKGDTVYKVLKSHYPDPSSNNFDDWMGLGGRPNGISGDGSTNFGFCIPRPGAGRSPVCWKGDTSYSFATDDEYMGEVSGSNYDGSIMVGHLGKIGRVWEIGKEPIEIPTLPGWKQTAAGGISEKGLVIGYGTGLEFGDRTPFVWSKENGTLTLNEYLFEFYGIEIGDKNLFTAYGISRDGRVMAGFLFTGGNRCSYLAVLDEKPLNTRPMSLLAKQIKDEMSVKVSWKAPYKVENPVIGYNIYRDGILLNTTPITNLSYEDKNVSGGTHTYAITAVYGDGESMKSKEGKVQIVAPGGCYSVKYVRADVEYNRNLQIHWGLPSSEILDIANTKKSSTCSNLNTFAKGEMTASASSIFNIIEEQTEQNAIASLNAPELIPSQTAYMNGELDLVYAKQLDGYEQIVLAKVGDYYYADNWNIAGMIKYDDRFQPVENIKIEGLPAIRGFASDGTSVYGVAGTKFIYEIDFEYKTIVNTIPVPEKARHITYIPELDGGNGGFQIGDYNTSIFIKKDGTKISDGFPGLVEANGAAYYKGKVYISQFTGKSNAEIHEFDLATKQATGFVFDFAKFPEVQEKIAKYGGSSGSMTLITLEDGTVCLVPIVQVNYGQNIAVFLELESMPGLKGFNLYKNNVKVNGDTPMKKRNFSETLLTSGTYTYEVSAVFENCESERSYAQTVIIDSILGCSPTTNLKAVEQNKNVTLRYDMPVKNAQSQLLGFNIYRDNQLLNKEINIYLQYQDSAPDLGKHTYRVESFYDNSCAASDSITIEVTHQGSCSQPEYLALNPILKDATAKTFDVEAQWEAPFFEEPLALRWGNGISMRNIGLQEGKTLAVAAGWDSTQVKMYRDYSIIGVELIIRDETKDVRPIVFINEKLVHEESLGRTPINEYFNTYFEKPIPIGNAFEVVVGYVAEYANGKLPFSMDNGPARAGYGDLFTTDFENWKAWGLASRDLGVNANWTIAIILAKPHNIASGSQYSGDWDNQGHGIVKVDMHTMEAVQQKSAEPIYAPSETLALTGFNIYRDGTKLNTEPIKDLTHLDQELGEGTYAYKVSSVWNTCDEIFAPTKNVKLAVTSLENDSQKFNIVAYPNPVKDILHIEGIYTNLEIFDIYGRKVFYSSQPVQDIDCKSYAKGIYNLRFVNAKGDVQIKKIVVE